MAQTGYTPILLYSSTTAAQAPAAGNLTNSTFGSELAINITDGKLFYKDNTNAVQVIAWKTTPTTAGGTGLTSYTAGDLPYYATGTTLSKLAIGLSGQVLTSTGTAPQWTTLSGVAVTTFSAGTTGFTPNSATSGAVTLAGTLITTNGGTGLSSYTAGDLTYYASGTTLTKLAIGASTTILTSSGTAPQWSAASNVTVGTATNLAGGVAGSVPYQTAAGTTAMLAIGASGRWLGSSGTAPQWNAPAALTETDDTNVTMTLGGNPSTALLNAVSMTLGWTGQLAVTRGGTGLATVAQGDILYGSAANTLTALAKNTTATRYLSNTGASNNPAWAQIDLSNGVTGTLPVGNGGTGLTSLTANRIPYGNGTSAFSNSSNFTYDGTNLAITGTNVALRVNDTPNGNYGVFGTISGNAYVASTGGYAIRFDTNGEAMRVFWSKGVSIGNTTDPGATNLSVTGTGKFNTTVGVGAATPATSGAGITFPATVSLSSDVNTLDDYEEGTWTPGLSASTSGTITIENPTNSMTYTKIGNTVRVSGTINIDSVSSPVGDLRLTGLPFASSNTGGAAATGALFVYGWSFLSTRATAVQVYIDSNSSQVFLRGMITGSQVTDMANTIDGNSGFIFAAVYQTSA